MDSLIARLRRFVRAEHGAELIEMALVTPVLLLILAGIFDFGFMFRSWEAVTNAAREGARVGVLPSYGCADGGPAEDRVVAYLTASGIPAPPAANIVPAADSLVTPAGTITMCSVTVVVPQALPSLSIITAWFGDALTTVNLSASSVMRTETQAAP